MCNSYFLFFECNSHACVPFSPNSNFSSRNSICLCWKSPLCVFSCFFSWACVWHLWLDFFTLGIRCLMRLQPIWFTLEPLVFVLEPLELLWIGSDTSHWVVVGLLSWSHLNFLGVEVEVILAIGLWLDWFIKRICGWLHPFLWHDGFHQVVTIASWVLSCIISTTRWNVARSILVVYSEKISSLSHVYLIYLDLIWFIYGFTWNVWWNIWAICRWNYSWDSIYLSK